MAAPLNEVRILNGTVFTSGRAGLSADSGDVPESFIDEVRMALGSLRSTLDTHGSRPDLVVRTTVFLTDISDYQLMNTEYAQFFSAPFPARSTVVARHFPLLHTKAVLKRARRP